MKRAFIIFSFILLFFISSCKENGFPTILKEANDLANTHPDSAINLLQTFEVESKNYSKDIQMYYKLLCIKAKDKAYIIHTTDSCILAIVDYYTQKGDKEHLPEAFYYAGRVYRDLGDAPKAITYFQQALDEMEKGLLPALRTRIASQMGTLLSEQCMYTEAVEAYKKALQTSVQEKDTIGMIYDLRDIGSTFCDMESYDSASIYLEKAYQQACTVKEERMKGMVEGQLAYLYTQLGEYEKAKHYINLSLKATDKQMSSPTYSIAAELYNKAGNKDSALHFYKELIKNGELYARTDAAWNLAQYALQDNKVQDAALYLKQYIAGIDSVWTLNDTEKVRQLRSTYNYNLREKENSRLMLENKQKRTLLIGAATLVFVLLLCFIIYFQHNQKERLRLNLQLEKLKRIEERQKIYGEKDIERKRKFRDTDIYQYVNHCIEHESYNISEGRWKELEKTLNEYFDHFTNKLSDIRELSSYELHICMLLKMEIHPKNISLFTHHSKESVSSTRRRMYEKFFGKKGTPQDWDNFIKSL